MICFVKIDATKVADCIVLSQRLDQSEPSFVKVELRFKGLDRELSMHCSCCQLSIHVHTTFPVWSNWKLPRVTSRQVIFFPSEKVASMWGKQALLGQGPNSPCVTHKTASFLGFWPIKAKVRSLHPNCNIQTSVVPHGPTWSTPGPPCSTWLRSSPGTCSFSLVATKLSSIAHAFQKGEKHTQTGDPI